jgi:pimeloyl-ACP methyl ester carboxylesterase|tara:strand:+ start:1779 stop:2552 length:774 start_codon:yes stop_codon:yes gene_type:complete
MQIDIDGAGPGLVLVHSLLTDARAYDEVTPRLARTRRVMRPSLPGFGLTPALDKDSPSLYDLADAVADGLADAGADRDTVVLGNGLGAFVSVALAIAHSDRFGPLVVANGGAVFSHERRGAFTTMSELVGDGGMSAVVDVAVGRIYTEDYVADHPHVLDERRGVLLEIDPTAFAAACRALRDVDLRDQAPSIDKPTLVIAGEADQTTPPEMAHELAELIPGAELVTLEGCGHCPPLEQPTAFADVLEGFLDRVSADL